LNLSALAAAAQLGLQPLIAQNAAGQPLYAPFPLHVTVPVMATGHFLFFGFVEAFVTASILLYFQKTDPSVMLLTQPASTLSASAPAAPGLSLNESES
jgi:cobalt/nickel transport system permease protein